eukprot:CAMPEP_0184735250 /NCGR_PEP_ID=MMETSP0314-20130426/61792_1 /TAXON_ID=38298 /ORGANISM="Rhodella maculata, Strain CCMP 736" /LENGTH=125 /DNA_ID=CAMNT_0027202283 /DNA_START=452 /DNA_END=829 /DNA_ORIENTATION=-
MPYQDRVPRLGFLPCVRILLDHIAPSQLGIETNEEDGGGNEDGNEDGDVEGEEDGDEGDEKKGDERGVKRGNEKTDEEVEEESAPEVDDTAPSDTLLKEWEVMVDAVDTVKYLKRSSRAWGEATS